MKNKKGISLIVLVITIIVIIILATALIVTLIKNNPISNAKEAVNANDLKVAQETFTMWISKRWTENSDEAGGMYSGVITKEISTLNFTKENTEIASINEKVYLASDVEAKEIQITLSDLGLDSLDKVVISKNTVISITKGDVTIDNVKTEYPQVEVESKAIENSTVTGKKPTYQNPVIPVGFSAKETTKATWKDKNSDGIVDGWNEGLVITDSNDNEYVWIPVDGESIKYAKWEGAISTSWTVKADQTRDDILPTGVTKEEEQIEKYGGYYVARYEASLPDDQTTEELMKTKTFSADDNNRTDIGKAQSKAGKIVWNKIDYTNAKTVSENVISTSEVQSGLITGKQWDTMLKFIGSAGVNVDTDCSSWGSYFNKTGYTISGYYRTQNKDYVYTKGTYTKSSSGYLLLETGKFGEVVSEGSPKNIYDVAGNVWEWSTEIVSEKGGEYTGVGNKVPRGGSYYDKSPFTTASYRLGNTATVNTAPALGFRIVLYIK